MKYLDFNYLLKSFFLLFCLAGSGFVSGQESEGTKKTVHLEVVSGKVLDAATHKGVVGAQVSSFDKSYSAMTKDDGTFEIRVPSLNFILLIKAPDYASREIPLQGRNQVVVSLYSTGFSNYYESILTPFGQERASQTIGARSSVINNENYGGLNLTSDILSKLGSLRTINSSGAPAIGGVTFLRGYNSLNSNNQPLIVVDGVILERPLDNTSIHQGYTIDPLINLDLNDIEQVTLLKDGTSIYGSKGGNGVLLITTRRGKSLATRVTFSLNTGVTTQPNSLPMMNAEDYRVYASNMLQGVEDGEMHIDNTFLDNNTTGLYYKQYHNNTDWKKYLYRNGFTQSYHIGVNGGDEVAMYNLSVGYSDAQSSLKKNDFSRLNARFNTDVKLGKQLTLKFDLSYSWTSRNLRDDGLAEDLTLGPISSPGILAYIKAPFLAPYTYTNSGVYTSSLADYDFLSVANPLSPIQLGEGSSQYNRFNVAVRPEYSFNRNFKLQSLFSYSYVNNSEHYYRPMYGFAPFVTTWNSLENQVKTQFVKQQSIYSNTYLEWTPWLTTHTLSFKGGFRYMTDLFRGDFASGYNTGSDHTKEMSGNLTNSTSGGYDDRWKSVSWFLDANYNFCDKYFISAAFSLDASSRFGEKASGGVKLGDLNYAPFPSLNVAWLISSESFMKYLPVVSLMKLRAGYGLSGNDCIPNESTFTYFKAVRYLYKSTGLALSGIGNPNIKWETTSKLNVGFDLNLFNERLLLSADLYKNKTNDLLTPKELDYFTGLDSYWLNGGKLENRGFEISMKYKVLNSADFLWEVGASIAHYKNKILSLPDGDYVTNVYGGQLKTMVGGPLGLFYGYKTNGIYSTTAEATDNTAGGGLSYISTTGTAVPFGAGDVRFVDFNGDKIISAADRVVIGDPNPKYFGNISTSMRFKSITLTGLFSYSVGNDIYNYLRSQLEAGSNFYNQTTTMVGRWQVEGQRAVLPKAVYGDPKGNNRFSDRWIENGSFLKLKNVTVSYNVPLKPGFLQGLTVWASASNLFTISKYLGPDPEFSINSSPLYQGIDTGLIPQSRSYYLGVKVNL